MLRDLGPGARTIRSVRCCDLKGRTHPSRKHSGATQALNESSPRICIAQCHAARFGTWSSNDSISPVLRSEGTNTPFAQAQWGNPSVERIKPEDLHRSMSCCAIWDLELERFDQSGVAI